MRDCWIIMKDPCLGDRASLYTGIFRLRLFEVLPMVEFPSVRRTCRYLVRFNIILVTGVQRQDKAAIPGVKVVPLSVAFTVPSEYQFGFNAALADYCWCR